MEGVSAPCCVVQLETRSRDKRSSQDVKLTAQKEGQGREQAYCSFV
jgi:hypothetical protein